MYRNVQIGAWNADNDQNAFLRWEDEIEMQGLLDESSLYKNRMKDNQMRHLICLHLQRFIYSLCRMVTPVNLSKHTGKAFCFPNALSLCSGVYVTCLPYWLRYSYNSAMCVALAAMKLNLTETGCFGLIVNRYTCLKSYLKMQYVRSLDKPSPDQ